MLDVNTWKFRNKEAEVKYLEGYSLVTRAIFDLILKGIGDSAIRRGIILDFKKGALLLEEALSLEHARSPLPHAQLAKANAHIGLALYYQEERLTPEIRAHFDQATVSAATAVTCYEQSTGWDAGLRFDLHYAVAQIHFFQRNFEKARQEIDYASLFRSDSALFTEFFDNLSEALRGTEQSAPAKAPHNSGAKSGGCLGVVGGGVALLAIVVLAVILAT